MIKLALLTVSFVTYATFDDPYFELVFVIACIAIVSGMPDPEKDDSIWYRWFYRASHLFFGVGTHYLSHRSIWKLLEPRAVELDRLNNGKADEAERGD